MKPSIPPILAAVATLVVAAGCSLQRTSPAEASSVLAEADEPALAETTPDPKPTVFAGFLPDPETGISLDWVMEERDGMAVVDGDIVLGPAADFKTRGLGRSLVATSVSLWTKGVVPYDLPASYPNRQKVLNAIQDYSRSRIQFTPRNGQTNFIRFALTNNPYVGGQSSFGMVGGVQTLWLNSDTAKWTTGTVIHELGHALAIAHEHCRKDRDQYVTIQTANVQSGALPQFKQLFGSGRDVGTYDYGSIMHYPRTAFSANGRETVTPRNGAQIGQRLRLSSLDISGLNSIYAREISTR